MITVAIDISPITNKQHAVRGVGKYIKDLTKSLDESHLVKLKRVNSANDSTSAEVYHIPYFDPFQYSLPKKSKQRLVVTIHDLIPLLFPRNFPPGIKGKIRWQIQKRALQKVDAIITDSLSSSNDIQKLANVPKSKINTIYLAADNVFGKRNKTLTSKTVKKFSLPNEFALYVGDVTWNKNVPNLIMAATKAKFPLILAGKALSAKNIDSSNSWNKDLLLAQRLLQGNSYCRAIGYVTTDELVDLYNLSTFFTFPSRYEGFGLPVLEAMQCQTPVLTTKNGSLSEVAGDAALFVKEDVESIRQGIEKMLSNTALREKLSKAGLENSKKFTWKKTALMTAEVYEKIHSK